MRSLKVMHSCIICITGTVLVTRYQCLMSNTTTLLQSPMAHTPSRYHLFWLCLKFADLSEQCLTNVVVMVVPWTFLILAGMFFLMNQEILQWQGKEQEKPRNGNRCPSEINAGVSSLKESTISPRVGAPDFFSSILKDSNEQTTWFSLW